MSNSDLRDLGLDNAEISPAVLILLGIDKGLGSLDARMGRQESDTAEIKASLRGLDAKWEDNHKALQSQIEAIKTGPHDFGNQFKWISGIHWAIYVAVIGCLVALALK